MKVLEEKKAQQLIGNIEPYIKEKSHMPYGARASEQLIPLDPVAENQALS